MSGLFRDRTTHRENDQVQSDEFESLNGNMPDDVPGNINENGILVEHLNVQSQANNQWLELGEESDVQLNFRLPVIGGEDIQSKLQIHSERLI